MQLVTDDRLNSPVSFHHQNYLFFSVFVIIITTRIFAYNLWVIKKWNPECFRSVFFAIILSLWCIYFVLLIVAWHVPLRYLAFFKRCVTNLIRHFKPQNSNCSSSPKNKLNFLNGTHSMCSWNITILLFDWQGLAARKSFNNFILSLSCFVCLNYQHCTHLNTKSYQMKFLCVNSSFYTTPPFLSRKLVVQFIN